MEMSVPPPTLKLPPAPYGEPNQPPGSPGPEKSALSVVVGATACTTTVRLKKIDFETPPLVAATVIGKVPDAAELVVLMVNSDEQFGVQLVDDKDAEVPEGNPETDRETA